MNGYVIQKDVCKEQYANVFNHLCHDHNMHDEDCVTARTKCE